MSDRAIAGASDSRGVISVFGSSRPQPGSAAYEQARTVGRLLADAGFAVATGGYTGTMAAVSDGAASAGGHVIGVGCTQIERFRPGGLNQWVVEAIHYETLRERLYHLVVKNDGMIALPGGVGTLSEMALAWSLLQVGEVNRRPLVLLGGIWREAMEAFIDPDFVTADHAQLLRYAKTPEEALSFLNETERS
jgi:uncharacterized protein (TIGR00730 family)